MGIYYDGTKLLSQKDINGKKPEIYICTTNRTGGKTVYFSRLCINRFLKNGEKFMLVVRHKYELDGCAEMFFKVPERLFFKGHEMTSRSMAKGIYVNLYLDGIHCGYAVALNCADNLKKHSGVFSDTKRMMFDEFQTESNQYLPDEVGKLMSIHTSVARGDGEQVRYVPVYMISNPVTILNPYYVELGITDRLNSDTRFLRGDGFVMEQGYVESASIAQKESAFNRAFSGNKYLAYSAENVYLNDSRVFIEKPEGKNRYVCTIKYEDNHYGLRVYEDLGIIYCDNHPDMSFRTKISVTLPDHSVNYVMLRNNDFFITMFRDFFNKGCFRFKDLRCKQAVLALLKY